MEASSRNPAVTRIVVVDDSKLFQQSLARLLATVRGIAIVGFAEDVASACKLIDELVPGIVVLDVELRGGDQGIDVLRHVAREHPAIQVLVLSNMIWSALHRSYLHAGAVACFDKSMEFEQARQWIASCAQRAADPGGTHATAM